MDPAATNPQPPEPSKDLLSSERVRFLTSWKLWLPMLFLALLLIAAAIVWPGYRRMRALDLIEARGGGEYALGDASWPWLASKLGRLGLGYHDVHSFVITEPISLASLESLTALSEARSIIVATNQVTPEWIAALGEFRRLKELNLLADVTTDDIRELLARLPAIEELRVDRLLDGNVLEGDAATALGVFLKELYIDDGGPQLTIDGFPALEYLQLDEMTNAELIVRNLPALNNVCFVHVNEGTTLTHDAPLHRLSYGLPEASQLVVPADVRTMFIQNIARCTITGGEDLESLFIWESADMTVADMPALKSIEFRTSFGGALTLRDLPVLEHFMLMTWEAHISPTVEFDGVDNLRAIDANWWDLDDEQLAAICQLPRLEHLVIPRGTFTEGAVPMLRGVETLRFLRFPRWMYDSGEVDFAQLRDGFPQPGIRVHGPPRPSELEDRWTLQ